MIIHERPVVAGPPARSNRREIAMRVACRSLLLVASLLPFAGPLAATNPAARPVSQAELLAKLVASDGAEQDVFGRTVAIDGDVALVGANLADVGDDEDRGAAWVFVRDGEGWSEQTKLTAPDGAAGDQFGFSVAIDGDTAVVGAWLAETRGAVYVFTRAGGDWVEEAKLVAADGAKGDEFGFSVAVDGDTILVGAQFVDVDGGPNQGAAYVFTRDGATWSQQAKLVDAEGTEHARFGLAVALDGDTAAIGAPFSFDAQGNFGQGAASVFVRSGASWSQQARFTDDDPDGVDEVRFGQSVALLGDTALIGAPSTTGDAGFAQGAVYVFHRSGAQWSEQARLTATDGAELDSFGNSVAFTGQTALIGAFTARVAGEARGVAYTFAHLDGSWGEQGKIVALDGAFLDEFGWHVALDGNIALIGARRVDIGGNMDQGAAYLFRLDSVQLLPDPLDFGPVRVGETRGPLSLTIANGGDANITISDLSGPEAPFSEQGGTCAPVPFVLAPGGSCSLGFTFSPIVPGSATGTVTLQSDTLASPHSVTLQGNGSEEPLHIAPGLLDFGGVVVDEIGGPLEVTLTNADSIPVEVSSVSMPASPFAPAGGTCGEAPFSLDPFTGCVLRYTFAPTATGSFSDVVEVTSDTTSDPFGFELQGQGLLRELTLTPDVLEFGSVAVGETGGPLSVTLTNTGDVDVCVFNASNPGAPFALVEDTCQFVTLPPDASCTLRYTFSPTEEGAAQTSVSITSDAVGSPHTVTLQGEGTGGEPGPGVLAVDPTALDFGDVPVGSVETESFTVSNAASAGSDDLELATLELTSGAPDFALAGGTCQVGTVLPPGNTCTVEVTFQSGNVGEFAGAVSVATTDDQTATVDLSGTGTEGPGGGFTAMLLEVDPGELLSDGNGIFEPGERVVVAPSWHNDGKLAAFLEGTASDFTGPEGPKHTIVVPDAEYGEIEPEAIASCKDSELCYELEIGPEGVERPAVHWDAQFTETLSDADETSQTWTLHVGDSFTDVPRSNLFYTTIETLLHSGVTGGCGDGSAYCPGDANTRSQMPAFMLRALEGSGYTPEACVEGDMRLFDDVPASNLFCPWIEDLADRGIVAGCGGGNFCPSDMVSRAQMSIFLLKTLQGADYAPPECSNQFTDVPCPSLFADWIEDLAARGITGGCTKTEYCPGDAVTRAQMASFITRAFGFTLYGP